MTRSAEIDIEMARLDQIEVWDTAGSARATWQSDDYSLRLAARDLHNALEYVFNIMHDYDSRRRKGYVSLPSSKPVRPLQRQSRPQPEHWLIRYLNNFANRGLR